jgi:hypothetical protein
MIRPAAIAAALLLAVTAPLVAQAQVWSGRHAPARPMMRPPMARMPGPRPRPPYPPAPNSLGAEWREQQEEAREGVRRGQLAPFGAVIDQLRRRTPGRQLDAGLEYRGERPVYRVRWMTRGGRRIDYIVDGATGAILSGE